MQLSSFSSAKQLVIMLGQAIWFPHLNHRREIDKETKITKDEPAKFDPAEPVTKVLIESFRDRGYDPQYPCVVSDFSLDVGLKDKAVEVLTQTWDMFKSCVNLPTTKPVDTANLVAFEYFYTHAKGKGKERLISIPDFLGCTGNRRSMCLFRAAVERLIHPDNASKDPFNHPESVLDGMALYAIQEHFDTWEQRTIRQLAENTAKTEGFKQINTMEVLYAVKQGVETARISQSDLRKLYKDGEGQRMHAFLVLNSRFPNLKMFDRLRLPETNPDAIIWSKLPQGEFAKVVRSSNKVTNDDWNAKLVAKGADIEPFMTEADVGQYLAERRTGSAKGSTMMTKPVIQSLQSGSPIKLVQDVVQDILTNKREAIDKYTAIAPTLNAVDTLMKSTTFNSVSGLITEIAAIEDEAAKVAFVDYLGKAAVGYRDEKVRARVEKALA